MSAHGTVEINNQRIGYWEAVRIVTGDPNVYHCQVHRLDRRPEAHHFQIEHRESDGAVVLAAKVLSYAADDQLKVDAIRATDEHTTPIEHDETEENVA